MNKVYTIGYAGWSPWEIRHLAENLDAALFDVRYSPFSRDERFCKWSLWKAVGDRYLHVKSLGNRNYKGGEIAIADLERGIEPVEQYQCPAILMCGCKKPEACHRTFVADALRERGHEVEEVPPPIRKPKAATQEALPLA